MNYGFRQPNIKIEDQIFGAVETGEILNESGQWDKWLPKYEAQAEFFETQGCTVWGSENCCEILHKFLFDEEPNYSERFTYILAGINFAGGDPGNIAEIIRNKGLIDDYLLPMTETAEEFIKPDPMNELFLSYGKEWLNKYDFRHQWVLTGGETKEQKINAMKEALKYSPLGVACSSWFEGENGVYFDNGQKNNHWCTAFGYDDEKQAWKIFDSYDHSNKLYSYDSLISVAKRYSIEKRTAPVEAKWWFQEIGEELWWFARDMVVVMVNYIKKI